MEKVCRSHKFAAKLLLMIVASYHCCGCDNSENQVAKADRLAKLTVAGIAGSKPMYELVADYKRKEQNGQWREYAGWQSVTVVYNLSDSVNDIVATVDSILVLKSQIVQLEGGGYSFTRRQDTEGIQILRISAGQHVAKGLSLRLDRNQPGSTILLNFRIRK